MSISSYKCPNCGGDLQYKPELQKMKCEYCLSEFTETELRRVSKPIDEKETEGSNTGDNGCSHLKGYICNNCGAEVVAGETTSATLCYYCHNPVLLTDRLTGEFKPTKIIPFTYDKDKAVASLVSWAKSRNFVPKSFYSTSQLDKVTGIYIPYWIADVKADVDFWGSATDTREWKTGNTEYTEHREYRIQRQGKVTVNNIREIAMKKVNKRLLESIAPYDESKAVDFSMAYLSGFFAEKYDIPKNEVQPVIEERAVEYVSTLINETIKGYNDLSISKNEALISVKEWEYTLLPVWILTYIYNGNTYVCAVNGQTGKAYGILPVDKRKLRIVSGIIAAAFFAFTIFGGFTIW